MYDDGEAHYRGKQQRADEPLGLLGTLGAVIGAIAVVAFILERMGLLP